MRFKFFMMDASLSSLPSDGPVDMVERFMIDDVGDKVIGNMFLIKIPIDPNQFSLIVVRA